MQHTQPACSLLLPDQYGTGFWGEIRNQRSAAAAYRAKGSLGIGPPRGPFISYLGSLGPVATEHFVRPAVVSNPLLMSVRSQHRGYRSLSCLLQALEGTRVVVELRNDTIIRGTLESSDQHMSLVMLGASLEPLQQPKKSADFVFLKGKHIRYVHMASSVDPQTIIEQTRSKARQAKLLHQRTIDPLTASKGVQEED